MSDDRPAQGTASVQYLLGDISARVANIHDLLARVTFRLDNLEGRVEQIEKNEVKDSPYIKVVEKAMWGILAMAGVAAAKLLGWA